MRNIRWTRLLICVALVIAASAFPAHAEIVVSSGDTVELTWQPNDESQGVEQYKVYESDSVGGPWSLFATVSANAHTIEPLTLLEGDHYFALTALDGIWESDMSEPSELVRNDNTPPSQPATITIRVVAK